MADYVSVLTGGSNNFATTSEHLNALATDLLEEGVVGSVGNTAGVAPATGGLACNAQGTPNMTVAVTAGYCYVTATPSGQSSQMLRANIAAQNATIAANSTGGTRYDWIYVTISAANAANPAAAGDNVASITVSRSTSSSTDNGTPPTYGYPIAVVTVANGASSITNGNIADLRESVSVVSNASDASWTSLGDTPDTVTYNGGKQYSLVYNSVDHSDTLGPGTRLKLTRSTTAPTQCTDLESGSSQYYSKSSPSGMTFTDDFTCMAWIKIENNTVQRRILGRVSGTNGFHFGITAAGYLYLEIQPGAGTTRSVTSQGTIPTNRWVHVAASMDASGGSTLMYVDGVSIAVTSSGAATSLTQAGDLQIGVAATTNYFDGKLAQVAIFSAVISASTIRSYISQGLSGAESSLISAYSFNNSITDLNTGNANNLTANGGAVATNADSPFSNGLTGTTDYAIVSSATFSTNTTVTAYVPDGYTIPTSGGVSATAYSFDGAPYGLARTVSHFYDANGWYNKYDNARPVEYWKNHTFTLTSITSGGTGFITFNASSLPTDIGASTITVGQRAVSSTWMVDNNSSSFNLVWETGTWQNVGALPNATYRNNSGSTLSTAGSCLVRIST